MVAGQCLDGSTGLMFYNARYYDPVIGRFISADTIVPDPSNLQDLNRYSYVRNNPTNATDPSGHTPVSAYDQVSVDGRPASWGQWLERMSVRHEAAVIATIFHLNTRSDLTASRGVSIPGSSKSGNTGRSDVLARDLAGIAYSYEIKSGLGNAAAATVAGRRQNLRYVAGLITMGEVAFPGNRPVSTTAPDLLTGKTMKVASAIQVPDAVLYSGVSRVPFPYGAPAPAYEVDAQRVREMLRNLRLNPGDIGALIPQPQPVLAGASANATYGSYLSGLEMGASGVGWVAAGIAGIAAVGMAAGRPPVHN